MFCELTELQSRLYQHILSLPDVDNVRNMESPCPCGRSKGVSRSECCSEYLAPFIRDTDRDKASHGYGERNKEGGREGEGEYGGGRSGYRQRVGEARRIDPRAVLWMQQHPDGACSKCPSCICLPIISLLSKVLFAYFSLTIRLLFAYYSLTIRLLLAYYSFIICFLSLHHS